jgi:hypothetical protein
MFLNFLPSEINPNNFAPEYLVRSPVIDFYLQGTEPKAICYLRRSDRAEVRLSYFHLSPATLAPYQDVTWTLN